MRIFFLGELCAYGFVGNNSESGGLGLDIAQRSEVDGEAYYGGGDGYGGVGGHRYVAVFVGGGVGELLNFGEGFVPGVAREGEFAVVHGDDDARRKVADDAVELLGEGVDVFPVFVILAVFDHCYVDAGEPPAYFGEVRAVSAVASDICGCAALEHERCPECRVLSEESS